VGRKWLLVDYQLMNAPQGLTTVNLPAWNLSSKSGAEVIHIPQWPVSVGPLTLRSVLAQGGLQELRADRPAPIVPTQPIVRQLEIGAGALLLTMVAWVTWSAWRNWRAAATRPFARAARDMGRLEDTAPEAWRALHRAFDRTAGRVVQTATLPELFANSQQLEPLRARIELFFAQSAEFFFGEGLPGGAISVHALCNDLRQMERRHER
jgi:mxaA protein